MKKIIKSLCSVTLVLSMLLPTLTQTFAIDSVSTDAVIKDVTNFMHTTVAEPMVGSIGGEWAVIGLARSGESIPVSYYNDYYETVEQYVKEHKGKLHDKKYTEYSRVALALTAIGKDPRSVGGYNLLTPLGDYEKTIWQGLNGPIWALIALDSNDYDVPKNPEATTQATRELYVKRILDCQLADGGFSLFGGPSADEKDSKADPDITGMVFQALANYQGNKDVKKATDEALSVMSSMQLSSGAFPSMGIANIESTAQMLVGLTNLGISLEDPRFVKNGNTVLDGLMQYYVAGKGFTHTLEGDGQNQMASEQGLYALVAVSRVERGTTKLYDMTDVKKLDDAQTDTTTGQGLEGKNHAVKPSTLIYPNKTFTDIEGNHNKDAIMELASRGIISGKTETTFAPQDSMTRAEFATIVVKALGLVPNVGNRFTDVPNHQWFAPYIGTAYEYGIIKGNSDTTFHPQGVITRQEAGVMVARAGALCGLDVERSDIAVRDMLSQFSDYTKSEQWAREALAFCYDEGILDQSDILIQPLKIMTRGEIAQMLFQLLTCAELL